MIMYQLHMPETGKKSLVHVYDVAEDLLYYTQPPASETPTVASVKKTIQDLVVVARECLESEDSGSLTASLCFLQEIIDTINEGVQRQLRVINMYAKELSPEQILGETPVSFADSESIVNAIMYYQVMRQAFNQAFSSLITELSK